MIQFPDQDFNPSRDHRQLIDLNQKVLKGIKMFNCHIQKHGRPGGGKPQRRDLPRRQSRSLSLHPDGQTTTSHIRSLSSTPWSTVHTWLTCRKTDHWYATS